MAYEPETDEEGFHFVQYPVFVNRTHLALDDRKTHGPACSFQEREEFKVHARKPALIEIPGPANLAQMFAHFPGVFSDDLHRLETTCQLYGELTELPKGMLRVRLRLNSLEEVERWILSMGTHATVVRPEKLRQRLFKATLELFERYGELRVPRRAAEGKWKGSGTGLLCGLLPRFEKSRKCKNP